MEHIISGLVKKRAELFGELTRLEADLRHLDATLRMFGYEKPEHIDPKFKRRRPSLFRPGELMRLVCDAERSGLEDNPSIADWIIREKGFDPENYRRVRESVKDCRKRIRSKPLTPSEPSANIQQTLD